MSQTTAGGKKILLWPQRKKKKNEKDGLLGVSEKYRRPKVIPHKPD